MAGSQRPGKQLAKLVLINSIKFGARLGLVKNPLIPSAIKRWGENLFRQLGPNAGTVTQVWESLVFEKFWLGDYQNCQAEIERELIHGKLSLARLDFLARLMWHGTSNNVWSVTPVLQSAWEHTLEKGKWDQRKDAQLTLGQWLAAQQQSEQPCLTWQPSQTALALAQLATQAQLPISQEDITQSSAAIRFSPPEQWLAGHHDLFMRKLQPELKLWARWCEVNGDDLTRRHMRRCMRTGNLLRTKYLITEGTAATSDLPLLIHGRKWMTATAAPQATPKGKTALYLLGSALPWRLSGYATRSHALLRALNSQGWTVLGAVRMAHQSTFEPRTGAPSPKKGTVADGVHYLATAQGDIDGYPTEPYWDACVDFAMLQVNEHKPALVHAASTWMIGGVARDVANRAGLPMIYEVRGFPHMSTSSMKPGFEFTARYRLHHAMEIQVATVADHVFAITTGVRDELIRHGVSPNKITLLPNGINRERFEPRERDAQLEQELELAGKTVIGYVGSLVEYEGLNLLIDALAHLLPRHPETVLLIVGDGPMLNTLRHQAHALGIDGAIHFTGSVAPEEVERYYSLIDIAPFPRLGLPVCEIVSPMKPFEALGMEKACVVSSVGALTDIVRDGETGLVFEKDSSASLAQVLGRLIADPELATRLGKQGRKWVLANRTWENHATHVHRIYEELLATRV